MANWKLLRNKSNVLDDGDVVGAQTLSDPLVDFQTPTVGGGKTRFVVVFVDAGGIPVTTGRGSFDLVMVEIITERDQVGQIIPETVILLDSVELQGGEGYRVMVVDDLSEAQLFSIRLINIDSPPGAVGMRVYFRELES